MKILIPLLLLAACRPSRQMQSQIEGIHLYQFGPPTTSTSVIGLPTFLTGSAKNTSRIDSAELLMKTDTIHEVMLISTRMPGFVFVKYGQAIQRNGICIAHLDCAGHLLKPPVYVWSCETEKKRREGR